MQIEWHDSAIVDLERLKEFILPYNIEAAQRAIRLIKATVSHIKSNSHLGKPVEGLPECHDLVIPFGVAGYVLRYRRKDGFGKVRGGYSTYMILSVI
jgi:plasmid stabilization system protein ParE